MSGWLRIFGRAPEPPDPALLLEELLRRIAGTTAVVQTDEQGWIGMEIRLPNAPSSLLLERFLASEKGIRGELNTWAAWLETCDYSANAVPLMERVIQTQQLFTLRKPLDHANEVQLDDVCDFLCRWLSRHTDGLYQIDNHGFFAGDGTLLVQEY